MPTIDYGKHIHESVFKTALRELDSSIHFDMGAKLGLVHPKMNLYQGVFRNGKHLASMDRGSIPEYEVWGLVPMWSDEEMRWVKARGQFLQIGWRRTIEGIARHRIPGLTREAICAKLGVTVKVPKETPKADWDPEIKPTAIEIAS